MSRIRLAAPGAATVRALGFTLIELLVVIAIIAVLIAILLPGLRRAHQASERVWCMSTLRQASMAMLMYCGDSKGILPWGAVGYGVSWDEEWSAALAPYVGIKRTDPDWAARSLWNRKSAPGNKLVCPTAIQENLEGWGWFYGANYPNVFPDSLNKTDGSYPNRRTKLSKVPRTAYLIADATMHYILTPHIYPFNLDTDNDKLVDTNSGAYAWSTDKFRHRFNCLAYKRHLNGANFVFTDGHVEWVHYKSWLRNDNGIWGPAKQPL